MTKLRTSGNGGACDGTTQPALTYSSLFSASSAFAPAKTAPPQRKLGSLCGERLDEYQLGRVVGVGGMAEVYQAWDCTLQREVAVKVLAAHLADDAEYAHRFWVEAHRVGTLCHPHLVPIYSAGEAEVKGKRLRYLVMPLLHESLRDLRQRRGKLPGPEASWMVLQLADGLEAAHRSGIVHRDVKPGNVLLDDEGNPLLGDFGIARELSPTASGVPTTHTGSIVGTPEYMAPEQLCGAPLDQRADVYSLGVVFYELLTGRLPFKGATAYDLAAHVLHAPLTPPSCLVPDVLPAVEGVLLTALARDPAQRYATAGTFAQALRHAVSEPSTISPQRDLPKCLRPTTFTRDDDPASTTVAVGESRSNIRSDSGIRHQLLTLVIAGIFIFLLMGSGKLLSLIPSSMRPETSSPPVARSLGAVQSAHTGATPAPATPAPAPKPGGSAPVRTLPSDAVSTDAGPVVNTLKHTGDAGKSERPLEAPVSEPNSPAPPFTAHKHGHSHHPSLRTLDSGKPGTRHPHGHPRHTHAE